jgi:hypothetical protein
VVAGDLEVWECERSFWLDTSNFYEQHVAPDALILLPLRKTPRWTDVTFSDQRSTFPSVDTALLAYKARAEAECLDRAYQACCSSTYIRVRRSWMLVAHQESALGEERELSERGALNLFYSEADQRDR